MKCDGALEGGTVNIDGLNATVTDVIVRNSHCEITRTPAFANSQRERSKVEALFAELKNQRTRS
jgi:hypothetical protein